MQYNVKIPLHWVMEKGIAKGARRHSMQIKPATAYEG